MARWRVWRWRIDLEEAAQGLPADVVEGAKRAADSHPEPLYPQLPYTESRYTWVLLYEHIHRGQIQPQALRWMRRRDLEYLAGHPAFHPELLDQAMYRSGDQYKQGRGQAMKIVENITRATRELERRTAWWRGWALAAGGAVFAALVQWLA